MSKILIADDEKYIREIVRDYMESHGIAVEMAANGEEAVEKCYELSFDLVILDVLMPKMNGVQACREIRKCSSVPILFLSALGEEENLLRAYDSGADDYVVKPFLPSVLLRKVQAMITRYRGIDKENRLESSGILVNLSTMKVYLDGKEAKITGKDYQLLVALMKNQGRVLTRDFLITTIWGYDYDGDNRVLDTHIRRLRHKLGAKSSCIKTRINTGYLFDEQKGV